MGHFFPNGPYRHLFRGQEAETVVRFSDLLGNDQPNVLRATGTTDATAEQPAERCEFDAAPCVAGARPCDDNPATVDQAAQPKSLKLADMSGIVRPAASQCKSGTAGTRTQNQRIMSPLL